MNTFTFSGYNNVHVGQTVANAIVNGNLVESHTYGLDEVPPSCQSRRSKHQRSRDDSPPGKLTANQLWVYMILNKSPTISTDGHKETNGRQYAS